MCFSAHSVTLPTVLYILPMFFLYFLAHSANLPTRLCIFLALISSFFLFFTMSKAISVSTPKLSMSPATIFALPVVWALFPVRRVYVAVQHEHLAAEMPLTTIAVPETRSRFKRPVSDHFPEVTSR